MGTKVKSMRKALSFIVILIMILATFTQYAVIEANAAESYKEWSDVDKLPTSGAYKLTDDVTVTSQVKVNGELILDLNGHKVTFSKYSGIGGIVVENGEKLVIEDNSAEKKGIITNRDGSSGSMTLIYSQGTGCIEIKGGTIETARSNIDAIYLSGSGKCVMSGGTVLSTENGGGGIYANSSSSLELRGGMVKNTAKNSEAVFVNSSASFLMEGGAVQNDCNGSKAVSVNGGKCSFVMTGGDIIQNSIYGSDAAIYFNNSTEAKLEVKGGNIVSKTKGIYAAFTPVTVTGGTIETVGYTFEGRTLTVDPAENSQVSITSKKGIASVMKSGSNLSTDINLKGGNFSAPKLIGYYASDVKKEPGAVEVTGGTYDCDPSEFVTEDSVSAVVKPVDGEKAYVIGESDIQEAAAEAATGDSIEITKGSVKIDVGVSGVTVTNKGEGSVEVNGIAVGDEPVLTHVHKFIKVDAKEATATEAGNIEYWYCEDCGKYFKDAEGKNEIKKADTVIPAKGEDPKDPGKDEPATGEPSGKDPSGDKPVQGGEDGNKTDTPKTADSTGLALWFSMAVLSAGAALAVLRKHSAN